MAKRPTKRPRYEWIRTLALAELPHHSDTVRPEFWAAIEAAVGRMKPSQRKIYTLYRCGMSATGIAVLLGWKKRSVYNRLAEIEKHLRVTVPVRNG